MPAACSHLRSAVSAPGHRRRLLCTLPKITALVACLLLSPAAHAQTTQAIAPPANSTTAFRDVIDGAGRVVRVPVHIARIVSLAPSMTETVFALGRGSSLVGVTDFCDFPPAALALPRVGGAINPSLEHVMALKPDVVLATSSLNRRETVDALEQLGVPVFGTSDPRTLGDVFDSIRRLAYLLDAVDHGKELTTQLEQRLAALQSRLAGRPVRRALFVVWHDPLITVGRNTFIADALRYAGAQSIIDLDQDWPRISLEYVVHLDPDVLVFAASHSETVAQTFETLAARPGWQGMTAVRERRYAVISDAVNRPAPRLVDAIEQLARQLHPAAFQEASKP